MKIKYNKEDDVLIVETAPGNIDHAEEMGPLIVHFTEDDKPVVLEILDASDFLAKAAKSSSKKVPADHKPAPTRHFPARGL